MTNPFFKNYGPIKLKDIYKVLKIKNDNNNKKIKIFDITDLNSASKKILLFFIQINISHKHQLQKLQLVLQQKIYSIFYQINVKKLLLKMF